MGVSKMKLFIYIVLVCLPSLTFASYLKLDMRSSSMREIWGNGLEEGLDVKVTYAIDKKLEPIAPEVLIPKVDNSANCTVENIWIIHDGNRFRSRRYITHTFLIRIATEVLADSGKCLIWIKHPYNRQTLSVIMYGYTVGDLY